MVTGSCCNRLLFGQLKGFYLFILERRERRGEGLEASTPICALTRQAQEFKLANSAFQVDTLSTAPPQVINRSFVKMSSASEPPDFKKEPPKEKDFRNPGLRGVRTTTLFRAVNPELFIKPNKPVMAFGLITLSLCVAYIGYLHATQENKKDLYEAIDSEGHSYMRRKTSKWD